MAQGNLFYYAFKSHTRESYNILKLLILLHARDKNANTSSKEIA